MSTKKASNDDKKDDRKEVRSEFKQVVNMTPSQLRKWLSGDTSKGVGMTKGGKKVDNVRDVHPLRTYGKPEDIANLVNWLAGDEARYASGQLWVIDGGLSAQVQQMRL